MDAWDRCEIFYRFDRSPLHYGEIKPIPAERKPSFLPKEMKGKYEERGSTYRSQGVVVKLVGYSEQRITSKASFWMGTGALSQKNTSVTWQVSISLLIYLCSQLAGYPLGLSFFNKTPHTLLHIVSLVHSRIPILRKQSRSLLSTHTLPSHFDPFS